MCFHWKDWKHGSIASAKKTRKSKMCSVMYVEERKMEKSGERQKCFQRLEPKINTKC